MIIRGAVQGVGFRPFVYRLAKELGVTGWVSNSNEGVWIEAEGAKETLDEFVIRIDKEHPRHAAIHGLEYSFLDALGFAGFEIRQSSAEGAREAVILPDIGTCPDCLHDILDPANRRYLYPFTNCTNCGPRFTIIERLPYDRANTTMRDFVMCAQCRAEYEDPFDRRFHAQPNACPQCGPQLELWDTSGSVIAKTTNALLQAAEALKHGLVVAVKGLGGYHLMVDASNDEAVVRLRELKHREAKPLAVMAPSLESVRELCVLGSLEERLISAPESPIVLLSRREGADIAPSVAPGNPYLGVMLPYTPLHHILLRELRRPVVATSGNRSDEPIAIGESDALRRLSDIADLFLVHNRQIRRHADDSVARIVLGREQILRRARGYAPLPIRLKVSHPELSVPTLAVGGYMKNTVALTIGPNVFISQHIGDLETKEAFTEFRQVIEDVQGLYETRPNRIAGDMHPDYASSAFGADLAQSRSLPFVGVQHHWAHVLACMAENAVESPALGVAWDGTGYGPDGSIWGGEFLLSTESGFNRVAHLRSFPLPGGDAAIRNPQHAAAGVLYEIFASASFTGDEAPLLRQMLEKEVRTPRTSSAGRLFDAVAAITGFRDRLGFEGQAAMELEFAAADTTDSYDYGIQGGGPYVIDWEPMIRQILNDSRSGAPRGIISAKFHNALAAAIVDIAGRVGEPRVVLTGGCFQNRYLTERTVQGLTSAGFCPYWHQRVPPNDGGLALGQAVAAHLMLQQEKACALQFQEK
jgi:hydrogenase maturation protein HypF